jgi:rRNA processing protein Krr1/Pno1
LQEDETTEVVTIKRAIQPALIGAGGKYAIRLEEKYGVKLSFPRDNKDKDGSAPAQKPDEVTIRGGKKGVAAAKAELLEAAAFENETRQTLTFTVPTKSVSQIVGKGGSTINGIKDETGAQIDIDKNPSEGGVTSITVRGDKKGITAAKAAVLELADSIGEEVTESLTVEPKYHRSLIGQGGQKLRDLITSAGGPSEGYKQAGIVTLWVTRGYRFEASLTPTLALSKVMIAWIKYVSEVNRRSSKRSRRNSRNRSRSSGKLS